MGILRKKKPAAKPTADEGPVLPPIEFKPTAYSKEESQGVLIACRQLPGFPTIAAIIAMAMQGRAEKVLLDLTAQGTAVRFRVDGIWETSKPLDRPSSDAAIVVLKRLVGSDPSDRKNRQVGHMQAKFAGKDWLIECVCQGVKAGERVIVTVEPKKPALNELNDLGMREKMQETLRSHLNATSGLVIISAPAGQGLPTSWRVVLGAADKFVRDFHAILTSEAGEPDIINITNHLVDEEKGETPQAYFDRLLLKQPDAFVLPSLYNEDFCGKLVNQLKTNEKHATLRATGNDAAEVFLKTAAQFRKHTKDIVNATTMVLCQRLVRRLCPACKQSFQPSPQLLQKLGIPRSRVSQLFQPFIPPPPEQRVDAKGNPIEIEICKKCAGRGYFGRLAIFELLEVTDEMRQHVLANPDINSLRSFAKANGHRGFQEEGILAVALGLTSLQEIQKMLQANAKA